MSKASRGRPFSKSPTVLRGDLLRPGKPGSPPGTALLQGAETVGGGTQVALVGRAVVSQPAENRLPVVDNSQ